ncbi:MAG: universal stress protein [Acidimicrobiales bacterium]|nr:universal stress protein [Acidimicrobiales bacterium]MCB1018232.1 universal stress protein [Acidimicrobiales bacterium]
MTYRTIVVGTDGSPTATRAVREAGVLAADHEARLVVVSAFTPERADALASLAGTPAAAVASRQSDVPTDLAWAVTDRAQAEAVAAEGREVAREAGAADVIVSSDAGAAARVLFDTARLHEAELVVVGSVGLRGPRRLLGSVAEELLHHAPCDVLVVPTEP